MKNNFFKSLILFVGLIAVGLLGVYLANHYKDEINAYGAGAANVAK